MTKLVAKQVDRFFYYMTERESIRHKKEEGAPWPWTKDKILQNYSFTNVKREYDRTSQQFISEFYQPNFNAPREQLLLNCALARYFGTIEFMRAIGWQTDFKPKLLKDIARSRLNAGERVYTGAYIITSGGMKGHKEDIVVDEFLKRLWIRRREITAEGLGKTQAWIKWQPFVEKLMTIPGFGGTGFMAKELALDTRYTSFWPEQPTDRNTWTPIGPGAQRGAAWLQGFRNKKQKASPKETLEICQHLFTVHKKMLPKKFIELELTDMQWVLCEFAKYERTRAGQGKPRSRYRQPESQHDLFIRELDGR